LSLDPLSLVIRSGWVGSGYGRNKGRSLRVKRLARPMQGLPPLISSF
jgi:hypothetical protein